MQEALFATARDGVFSADLLHRAAALLAKLSRQLDCGVVANRRSSITCKLDNPSVCSRCAIGETEAERAGEYRRADETHDALEAALQVLDAFRRRR